ncbi:MAG: site-2 protease family protein [Candidatus Omnitrophica bacterium]|nr:site-2 protease family protein [Candidatus Omnitrophota bacterium]MCM8831142.1 site-2 protease family protein [Candidatus Omnitrophota bacterium]
MGLINVLFANPIVFVILVPLLIYSVVMHEIAHAWVAFIFKDDTAKYYGRLSLNPLRHIDIGGLLMLFLFGFGWAKPVPINYINLKNSRLALFSVAIAGCLMNFIIAILSIFFLQFPFVRNNFLLASIFFILARINITLSAFNIIPIPPLDGSKIFFSFLPEKFQYTFAKFEIFGFFILIILLWTKALEPVIELLTNWIISLINLLFRFNL